MFYCFILSLLCGSNIIQYLYYNLQYDKDSAEGLKYSNIYPSIYNLTSLLKLFVQSYYTKL